MPARLSIEEVKRRIFLAHGGIVTLDESTYINTHVKCSFYDKDYGIFDAIPKDVYDSKRCGHRDRGYQIKRKLTNMERFGVPEVSLSKMIREKQIQSCIDTHGVPNPAQNKNIAKSISHA